MFIAYINQIGGVAERLKRRTSNLANADNVGSTLSGASRCFHVQEIYIHWLVPATDSRVFQ
jgi:hypothetical protein